MSKKLDKQIAAIDAQIEALQVERVALHRSRKLTCFHCKRKTAVGTLTYVQTYYYRDDPYNPRYVPSEGQYMCPKCGEVNRLHDFQGHADTPALKPYFATVIREND